MSTIWNQGLLTNSSLNTYFEIELLFQTFAWDLYYVHCIIIIFIIIIIIIIIIVIIIIIIITSTYMCIYGWLSLH